MISGVLTYDALVNSPGIASRYAGEEVRKVARSFASEYFSRMMVRSSLIDAP